MKISNCLWKSAYSLSGRNAKSNMFYWWAKNVADVPDVNDERLQVIYTEDCEFNCVDDNWDISIRDEKMRRLLMKLQKDRHSDLIHNEPYLRVSRRFSYIFVEENTVFSKCILEIFYPADWKNGIAALIPKTIMLTFEKLMVITLLPNTAI